MQSISGKIVDVHNRSIYPGTIWIDDGKINRIEKERDAPDQYILPGFVDAHIHIESSMLVPSAFAPLAVAHGTLATVSDPHEIANVMGMEGVYFMIQNGKTVPLKFHFGAPSCVPATVFETAGATIGPKDIGTLMADPDIYYLAEMMNYPGVLYQDQDVMEKLRIAKQSGKPIDGHAPGLKGDAAQKYIEAGIQTDHECFSLEEALDKLRFGMKIIIREGSAAKNYEVLKPIIDKQPDQIMFCSDDKHPDDLIEGHINQLVARAVADGFDLFDVLTIASLNPVSHYQLDMGLLRIGDPADFLVMPDLENFNPSQVYINGQLVAKNGKALFESPNVTSINHFNCLPIQKKQLEIKVAGPYVRVIEAKDGALITSSSIVPVLNQDGLACSDLDRDVLKFCVINRYQNKDPALAFIQNFGLRSGAIASCVGHDSHNILAVGCDDKSMCRAINLLIEHKGGISAVNGAEEKVLPLPIAGIMSDQSGVDVGIAYAELDQMAKEMGSKLSAPFMTLSFMALLVIPSLKLSDLGLFDGERFAFTPLFVDSPDI